MQPLSVERLHDQVICVWTSHGCHQPTTRRKGTWSKTRQTLLTQLLPWPSSLSGTSSETSKTIALLSQYNVSLQNDDTNVKTVYMSRSRWRCQWHSWASFKDSLAIQVQAVVYRTMFIYTNIREIHLMITSFILLCVQIMEESVKKWLTSAMSSYNFHGSNEMPRHVKGIISRRMNLWITYFPHYHYHCCIVFSLV